MIMIAVFFVLGLIFGSFFNVVVSRLRSGESFMTRSHCVRCGAPIHWYDNVPVLSFVWLRARCRSCVHPISWQYPLMELSTAVLFALVGAAVFDFASSESWFETGYWLVLFSVLVVVFVYDLLYMEIPMIMIWIGLGATLVWLGGIDIDMWRLGAWSLSDSVFLWHSVSGIAAFTIFATVSKGSGERWMGFGDAWLMLLLGAAAGWPSVLWAVTVGSGIGSVVGLALMATGKKSLGSRLPFAPFLITGFVAVVLFQWIVPMY